MKIIKNKFGELAGSPIFKDGKVIFPTFVNPEIAKEDEEWEVELVKIIPLNKVDKKGQPMFKGVFRLMPPVIPDDREEIIYKKNIFGLQYPFSIILTKYYAEGGIVKVHKDEFWFGDKSLPAEIKEKYGSEIERHNLVQSYNKTEYIDTKNLYATVLQNFKVDIISKKLRLEINYLFEVIKREFALKSIEPIEVGCKETITRYGENYKKEFVDIDIDITPKKRKIHSIEYKSHPVLTEADGTPVKDMGEIYECVESVYTQYGYEWKRVGELPPISSNYHYYNIDNGFYTVHKVFHERNYFTPRKNTPRIDSSEVLFEGDWDEVLPETKTVPEEQPKPEKQLQKENKEEEIFEDGIYHLYGEIVFKIENQNPVAIANTDAEDIAMGCKPQWSKPTEEQIKEITYNKKKWRKL